MPRVVWRGFRGEMKYELFLMPYKCGVTQVQVPFRGKVGEEKLLLAGAR